MGNCVPGHGNGSITPVPGGIVSEKRFFGLIEEKTLKEDDELLKNRKYNQLETFHEGVHTFEADDIAGYYANKTHIKPHEEHSVRSSPSLTSLKNEIVAMHEEIHNRPIVIEEKFKGANAFTLNPVFDTSNSKCDERIQHPVNLLNDATKNLHHQRRERDILNQKLEAQAQDKQHSLVASNLTTDQVISTLKENNFESTQSVLNNLTENQSQNRKPVISNSVEQNDNFLPIIGDQSNFTTREPSRNIDSKLSDEKPPFQGVIHHRDSKVTATETVDFNSEKYDRVGPGNLVRHATIIQLDPVTGKAPSQAAARLPKLNEDGMIEEDEGLGKSEVPSPDDKIKMIDNLQKDHEINHYSREDNKAVGMETSASMYSNCGDITTLAKDTTSRAEQFQKGLNDQVLEEVENSQVGDPNNQIEVLGYKPEDLKNPEIPPFTPEDAIAKFGDLMTDFEKEECKKFPEIWFCGAPGAEKVEGCIDDPNQNHGYDDPDGIYYQIIGDQMNYRYEILQELGAGAFGSVIKAKDHKTGQNVAVKLIRNKKRFHQQALIEVKILNILKAAGEPKLTDFWARFCLKCLVNFSEIALSYKPKTRKPSSMSFTS